MPRNFYPATAEQLVSVVEAVVVRGSPVDAAFVAAFCDLLVGRTEATLNLAVDIGLLSMAGTDFIIGTPVSRFLITPFEAQKAAVLRIQLESYDPFLIFRERLSATNGATTAAQQTKVLLDLNEHWEVIKDTLLSLGTYSHALLTEGGGRYQPSETPILNALELLASQSADRVSAEARIRAQLGDTAAGSVSRTEVIIPLVDALIHANQSSARSAVVSAGNSVESFLSELAARSGTNIVGATGLNAKLDRLDSNSVIPKKLVFFGKYLGHIRNAADHGTDTQVGASWIIRESTGIEYVFVACTFINNCVNIENQGVPII